MPDPRPSLKSPEGLLLVSIVLIFLGIVAAMLAVATIDFAFPAIILTVLGGAGVLVSALWHTGQVNAHDPYEDAWGG